MSNRKTITFEEGQVTVDRTPCGSWIAGFTDHNFEPGYPVGWGDTMMEAIVELRDEYADWRARNN